MQPCDTIGSHLCERLLAEGNDIICIDNYFTGHKSNIRHLLSHPNFEVIRHDIVYPYMAEIEEIYGDPLIHPSARITGATSTRWASARATTRANAAPSRSL